MARRAPRPPRIRSAVLACVSVAACTRPTASVRDHGDAAAASPDAAAVERSAATSRGTPVPAVPLGAAGEAARSVALALNADARLRPFLAPLRDHFGSTVGPFRVQWTELANGRAGVLVARRNDGDPIVLAVDRDQIAWSKPRPAAGIVAPFEHTTIVPGPERGIAFFGYVAALGLVAARLWADDGDPFADIELATVPACDALSAAYGPGIGWVVVCTSAAGVHAQRLREDGTVAWGPGGAPVGATTSAGPATVVFDAPGTWVMLERVRGVGADHALAWRYDDRARALWPAPVDLGPLPASRVPLVDDRLAASPSPAGGLRVALQGAGPGVEIRQDGGVRTRRP